MTTTAKRLETKYGPVWVSYCNGGSIYATNYGYDTGQHVGSETFHPLVVRGIPYSIGGHITRKDDVWTGKGRISLSRCDGRTFSGHGHGYTGHDASAKTEKEVVDAIGAAFETWQKDYPSEFCAHYQTRRVEQATLDLAVSRSRKRSLLEQKATLDAELAELDRLEKESTETLALYNVAVPA